MDITIFIGKMASGKTTSALNYAEDIKLNYGKTVILLSYADALKQMIFKTTGLTKSHLILDDTKQDISVRIQSWFMTNTLALFGDSYYTTVNSVFDSIDEDLINHYVQCCYEDLNYSRNYRELIQLLGTEIGRAIHPHFWSKFLINKLKLLGNQSYYQYSSVVIDDMRFLTETMDILSYAKESPHINLKFRVLCVEDSIRQERLGLSDEAFFKFNSHKSESEVDDVITHLNKNKLSNISVIDIVS